VRFAIPYFHFVGWKYDPKFVRIGFGVRRKPLADGIDVPDRCKELVRLNEEASLARWISQLKGYGIWF
jgi:hypothetical protein